MPGYFIIKVPKGENTPLERAHTFPRRPEILARGDTITLRPKKTRFADEVTGTRSYEHHPRGWDDPFDDYIPDPVRISSPIRDYGYSHSGKQIEHPQHSVHAEYGPPPRRQSRPRHSSYGADHHLDLDDYLPAHDYPAGRNWSVAHRPTTVRQNSHHVNSRRLNEPAFLTSEFGKDVRPKRDPYDSRPPPPTRRRSSYEYDVEQIAMVPQPPRSEIINPFDPYPSNFLVPRDDRIQSRQDSSLGYLDRRDGRSRRRSRSRYVDRLDSFSDRSDYGYDRKVDYDDWREYGDLNRDRYTSVRRRRSKSPLQEREYDKGSSLHIYARTQDQQGPSPPSLDDEYVPSRRPRPYSYAEAPMEDVRYREQERQSDKDITAMQLAKYTGGIPPQVEPTINISSTKSAGNQRRRSSTPEPDIGALRSRATYVEDTIDDDDGEKRSIHGRIFEIHDEPEPLIIAEEEETTQPHQNTSRPPKVSEASGWTFGAADVHTRDRDYNNKPSTTAADDQGGAASAQSAKATETADVDVDWGFSAVKKRDKKKKKKATSASTSKWDDWEESTTSAARPRAAKREAIDGTEDRRKSVDIGNINRAGEKEEEKQNDGRRGGGGGGGDGSWTDDEEKNWSWASNKQDWDDWEERRGRM